MTTTVTSHTPTPEDIRATLHAAGADIDAIEDFVVEWASITTPARIEVISPDDEQRLIDEALACGELLPVGKGRYLARSHVKDTARSEERTVVATNNPADAGVYNNWRDAAETKAAQIAKMTGASSGKTMYVLPYLMAEVGSPLERFAAGVELTDDRLVVLQMLRMARVGIALFKQLKDPSFFVKGVHVTGDLDAMGHGTDKDQRLFATIADERMIVHFGSAYGGNALLGKIAHALRLAAYDGFASGEFLAEQFLLLAIVDKHTGERFTVCGGFPSASGKTNLAMTKAPIALDDRYSVEFYGDDIAWLWPGEDGRLYGMNPEFGVFGVAKDTNEKTNPEAIASIEEGSGAIFTNVAYNEDLQEVWWEGKTPTPPADITGWRDWTGALISERSDEEKDLPWAHPNSRFTTTMANVRNVAADYSDPKGVAIDAVIFGGRTRDREPLIRALADIPAGVYDGLTLGAEATFAAEGLDGQLRYDPMSMRPFMSYPEGAYAAQWLKVVGACAKPPVFAHVNWFQRDANTGEYLWPGYRDNLRALLWLKDFIQGKAEGTPTAIGVLPKPEELNCEGLDLPQENLEALLTVDEKRWREELKNRRTHLEQFENLPVEIWQAHEAMESQFL
ncbi:phosphoenolpyruvate carboxykinase (GTP) [Corynebacterium felinum]|uniref:Phosphoenolpyruvate carboxykinase [GTP] n=1 Tax=Corynebacterium felinum TaxID=131318 RepID=A0ABU2B4M6_9CORY|nr:phosphoenolpyruvate carboxykinase (GTP) [Corynebacterium felinum]MDF5820523.1 phosphoenolpyruvate carboxykinase (GTP) [Corynebacterium felinum]MDR7353567.1 phosphoenolpyruvate carboxykinase (GTP) [Corynebacterium felinum]WJY95746.1 Phosphoenolpyruvate carboxykinase [GTP] [Corynebacterium felinum]